MKEIQGELATGKRCKGLGCCRGPLQQIVGRRGGKVEGNKTHPACHRYN